MEGQGGPPDTNAPDGEVRHQIQNDVVGRPSSDFKTADLKREGTT